MLDIMHVMWFVNVFNSGFQVGVDVGSVLSGFSTITWIVVHFTCFHCYFGCLGSIIDGDSMAVLWTMLRGPFLLLPTS